MARPTRIAITVQESVTRKLRGVSGALRSPAVEAILMQGAELMAEEARRRAPVRTGALRGGIYTMSPTRSNYKPVMGRRGRNVVLQPRYPPKRGQVLVMSGTFYSGWVEYGRRRGKKRARLSKRAFFRPGIRDARPRAEALIAARLAQLLEGA